MTDRLDPPEPGADDRDVEVEALRRTVERLHRIARREAREARRELSEVRATLKATRESLARIEHRRSVRAAIAMADGARRAMGSVAGLRRRIGSGSSPARKAETAHLQATEADVARFVAAVERRPAGADPPAGPLISMVMLNRDGAALLRRCLPALAETAYPALELIVVDNGSSDDSIAIIEALAAPFPVRIVRNGANRTFSEANNQALADCRGDLVLFINNDIEPIGRSWLADMAGTIDEPGVAAVGARLIYPRRTGDLRAGLRFADLSLQHGGVDFAMVDGFPIPRPMGAGDDALSEWASAVRDVPGLTAACLLVRRDAFEAVGGFTLGYDYGQEDVDLCLKLRENGGRLVYDGRATLWHHESATRESGDRSVRTARVAANRERFVATWGARLYRTVILDAIRGRRSWRAEALQVGFVPGPDGSLASSSLDEGRGVPGPDADPGWLVRRFEPGKSVQPPLDVLIVGDPTFDVRTIPPGPIRVAAIRGPLDGWLGRPWLDEYDIVLVDDEAAVERLGRLSVQRPEYLPVLSMIGLTPILERWVLAVRFGLRIGVPSWDVAPSWGDLHLARGMRAALARAGHPASVHLRPDWGSWLAARDDVAVHLLGLADGPTRSGQLNVLWHISHPDMVDAELYGRYDQVFVASDSFAQRMAPLVTVPVAPLHQATDPDRFAPGGAGPTSELLLIANSRGRSRHILDDLLPTDRALAVYGRGWTSERLEPRYLAGETVPNDELGDYYAAAAIVLNDHWSDMQREGFVSNRLYDASAAGAFAISDDVAGIEAEFDGGVVVYRDRAELRQAIDHFLDHPAERRAHAERARAAVLARHTFTIRVGELLDGLGSRLTDRPMTIDGPGAPERPSG